MSTSEKDPEIAAAYERLGAALAAPLDAAERVAGRMRVRRRRRRAGVVGAVGVVALATVGAGVLLNGGNGDDDGLAVDQPDRPDRPESSLVMTRPDGSTYSFSEVTVSCKPPVEGLGSGKGRIWMASPMRIEGERVAEPFVLFEGIVAKLQGGRTFELPVDGPGGSDTYPLTLFIADLDNEVSSAQLDAEGTVRVLRATCDPTPVLQLEVDATLGSEEQKGTLRLAGTVR